MMTKQANFQKDLTKKDLIKLLEKIDSERTSQGMKEYSFAEEDIIRPRAAGLPSVSGIS
ncbi:MAG TPA: hypothetical protein VK885_08430 [Desulfotignum sp.]|jgi:hypothetical protein|nr:hypothetical protein [Desulfotignum sp.]